MKAVGIAGRMGTGKDTCATLLQKEFGYVVVGFADELKRVAAKLFPDVPLNLFWGSSDERNKELGENAIDRHDLEYAAEDLYRSKDFGLFEHKLEQDIRQHLVAALSPHLPITTPRKLLQLLGTEWGRSLQDDVWLKAVGRTAELVAQGIPYFRQDGPQPQLFTRFAPAAIVVPDCRYINEAQYIREGLGGKVFWLDASKRVQPDTKFAHTSEPSQADLGEHVDLVVRNNADIGTFLANIRHIVLDHLVD